MEGAILRTINHEDVYIIVILISLFLHVLSNVLFRVEYRRFLQNEASDSINRLFVFLISNLAYWLILSLIILPIIGDYFLNFLPNKYAQIIFSLIILIVFSMIKFVLKLGWSNAYGTFSGFTNEIGKEAILNFYKYVLGLLFVLTFQYTEFKSDYQPIYSLYFFIGIYVLDLIYELIDAFRGNLRLGLNNFLYLCTLEILPLLVFSKFVFTIN